MNISKLNMPQTDLQLNNKTVLHKLNRVAAKVRQLDFIIREVSTRMLDRLDYIKIKPEKILDIGSGINIDRIGLKHLYPKSNIYSIDFALQILTTYSTKSGIFRQKYQNLICADALSLPIASQSVDLVWSNLTLPYINDIKQYFVEINRVLKLGATFLVSGLGVDSLEQIRKLGLATFNFPDMHLIGDILVELGFTNPVTDLEYITLEYDKLSDLLSDIRIIGGGAGLHHHLSVEEYKSLSVNFAKQTHNGKFPLTLEVFYAHAWKDKIRTDLISGRSIVQFTHSH